MIVAASGRALAASARRAGFVPLVADAFGDQDTLAAAAAHLRIDLTRPIDRKPLLAVLTELAGSLQPRGLVWGTGFEDRPDLLAAMAEHWPLLGNGPEVVTRLKNPLLFAALCRSAGIPHPDLSLTPVPDPENYLLKRVGGAGGLHIRSATEAPQAQPGSYFQRRVAGRPVSALLVADGRKPLVLGFTEQWPAPLRGAPHRYGGAVRPARLDEQIVPELVGAIERLLDAVPLVGINSADFLVDGPNFYLLEVNPRPTATLELFDTEDAPIFSLHERGCVGLLPEHAPAPFEAMATQIVYAEHDIVGVPDLTWPTWTRDRPVSGGTIKADDPVCTVLARAATAADARMLVERRAGVIRESIDRELQWPPIRE